MQKCSLFLFSGSGNTRFVASNFASELSAKYSVSTQEIDKITRGFETIQDDFDITGIIYPVHALNAPAIFFSFIKDHLPEGKGRKAFIVKSPGDPFFQGGSSYQVRKALTEKGYSVVHESMIVMPANVFLRFPDHFITEICLNAKEKIASAAREIIEGKERRHRNSLLVNISTAVFSAMEHAGSFFFGKDLKISDRCTNCGKCIIECPVRNIREGDRERPVIGWKCMICMRCIYGCPADAISPRTLKFFKVEWYDLKKLSDTDRSTFTKTENVRPFYKRYREYLDNKDAF